MLIRFSQKWSQKKYEALFRKLIRFVKGSRTAPDLLVKIFFYTKPRALYDRFNGNFRTVTIHGFYDSEKPLIEKGINSIVTLKLCEKQALDSDLDIWEVGEVIPDIRFDKSGKAYRELTEEEMSIDFLRIFAHEYKHYLDMNCQIDRSKYRHWEVRADRFQSRIVGKWKRRNREEAS